MPCSDTPFTASGSSPGASPPPKPVTIPYTFEKIPAYFCERPQWVCWKYVMRDKWTKPPFQAQQIGALAARQTGSGSLEEPANFA
jgi:hypothetical protein